MGARNRTLVWRLAAVCFAIPVAAGFNLVSPDLPEPAPPPDPGLQPSATPPSRIVSVVPAVTEMLFAIGAGSQVVAVSSFDRVPEEAARLPRVGALIDPDLERILSLRPDLAVVYGTQVDLQAQLERAAIPIFTYVHGGLADVTRTIREVGRVTGHAASAEDLAARIERDLEAIRRRVAGRARPRTLLVFGRDPLALRNVLASGAIGFLHDLLVLAGGHNVFDDVGRESVHATAELILARRPEVILELRSGGGAADPAGQARERRAWDAVPSVPAVREGRVHVLAGDQFVVPGPRVASAAEALARALHPQAFQQM